jgi:hypothetical protein
VFKRIRKRNKMTQISAEEAAQKISEFVQRRTGLGEIVMLGPIKADYDLDMYGVEGFVEGLKKGEEMGLFSISGTVITRLR